MKKYLDDTFVLNIGLIYLDNDVVNYLFRRVHHVITLNRQCELTDRFLYNSGALVRVRRTSLQPHPFEIFDNFLHRYLVPRDLYEFV